jgi:KUP system potassium uptake protein
MATSSEEPAASASLGTAPVAPDTHAVPHARTSVLVLGALGVVYGDIGTSPLYALKECLSPHYNIAAQQDNVLGLLSLMVWSLTMVVTVKYLAFILRANNRGEGGILALLALTPDRLRQGPPGKVRLITLLVIIGAALLYGDGMITPAISVLSAVEGLGVATHKLDGAIVPITCVILFGLFLVQKHGTGKVGALFGPIVMVWFAVLAGLGIWHISENPEVLAALSPHHAIWFVTHHGFKGFAVLGSVVLCVTGGEALYADMGHFGARPIRIAWLSIAMPALILAYFGQGARVLADPSAAANPFFAMVPGGWPLYAMVGLATAATVIASQALISGAYSLTHQAVQLGVFPRVFVRHTSEHTEGQIYLREINWMLAASCIALVLTFGSSTRLAAAYGIAVCGTMAITSVMFAVVAHTRWNWPPVRWAPLLVLFLVFDLGFLSANLLKFAHGGFVPVIIGAIITVMMVVWAKGRTNLADYYARRSVSWEEFVKDLHIDQVARPDVIGVFMASDARGVPPMMVHLAERIGSLPATALLFTVRFEHVPAVDKKHRIVEIVDLGHGFHRVVARYGFMQQPNVPEVMGDVFRKLRLGRLLEEATYYLGRETFIAGDGGHMTTASEGLFKLLSRNAMPATAYFQLPTEQVVEIGLQIDL